MKKLFLVMLVTSMIACKKKEVVGPQGPKGDPAPAVAAGSISGKVIHLNEDGVKYTGGLNTGTVTVDELSKSTVTDAAGNYTLTGIAPGVYSMTFQKPGTGKLKKQQVTHPGNGTLIVNVDLADKPSWQLTSSVIKDTVITGTHYLKISLTHPPSTKARYAFIFFSLTDQIDPENADSYDSFLYTQLSNGSSTNPNALEYSLLPAYASGSIYYAQVFPVNPGSSYYDYLKAMYVYPCAGQELPVHPLVMP